MKTKTSFDLPKTHSSRLDSRVTILVPTKNRPEFVQRLLNYFSLSGFYGQIFIGDGSDLSHFKENQRVISNFKNKLFINSFHFPQLGVIETYQKILNEVKTPYAVLLPDDDFLSPKGISSCVSLLEQAPGIVGAHGLGISIELSDPGPYGAIRSSSDYPMPSVNGKTACERLRNLLERYTQIGFAVYRTEILRKAFEKYTLEENVPPGIIDEIFLTSLFISYGSVSQVNEFYLVRHIHEKRRTDDFFDIITNKKWSTAYHFFESVLTRTIVEVDKVDLATAKAVVKNAYWAYLLHGLQKGPNITPNNYVQSFFKFSIAPLKALLKRNGLTIRLLFLLPILKKRLPYHRRLHTQDVHREEFQIVQNALLEAKI